MCALLAAEGLYRLISFPNLSKPIRRRRFSRPSISLGMCSKLKATAAPVIVARAENTNGATVTFSKTSTKGEATKKMPTRRQGSTANTNDIARSSSFQREVNTEFSRWIAIWQLASTFIDRLDANKRWQPSSTTRRAWSGIQFHVDRNLVAWLHLCQWNRSRDQRKYRISARLNNAIFCYLRDYC